MNKSIKVQKSIKIGESLSIKLGYEYKDTEGNSVIHSGYA